MLKLLVGENTKRLVLLLKKLNVDAIRLQDLDARGISGEELVGMANELERTILTIDSDSTTPSLLSPARNRIIYISYQSSKNETQRLAERIASVTKQLQPKPGLSIVIDCKYVEVYD